MSFPFLCTFVWRWWQRRWRRKAFSLSQEKKKDCANEIWNEWICHAYRLKVAAMNRKHEHRMKRNKKKKKTTKNKGRESNRWSKRGHTKNKMWSEWEKRSGKNIKFVKITWFMRHKNTYSTSQFYGDIVKGAHILYDSRIEAWNARITLVSIPEYVWPLILTYFDTYLSILFASVYYSFSYSFAFISFFFVPFFVAFPYVSIIRVRLCFVRMYKCV